MAAQQHRSALGEGQPDSGWAAVATIHRAFIGSRMAPVQTPPRDSEKPGRNACEVIRAAEKLVVALVLRVIRATSDK
jgi:hypothetical protein